MRWIVFFTLTGISLSAFVLFFIIPSWWGLILVGVPFAVWAHEVWNYIHED